MKLIIAIVVLIGAVAGFILLSPKASPNETTQSMSIATIEKAVASGGQFYDVRTPEEYLAGHIAGASNWSLQQMQAGTLPTVAKDTPVYVYCHSGNRSGQATAILEKAGFTNVTDLGAITHVQQIGGKIVKA